MDITELENFRLADAVKFHNSLNPRIWGSDEHLLPEVRQKLLAIAEDFKEFLGLDLEVTDITISGSNAAYTYTDHSDIDLHLVADLPRADANEVYRELFDAKKYQYNDQHNFKIGGYDVELYVQNANETPVSQGIYSVLDNKWISVPKRRKPDVDDISVRSKYEDLGQRIEAAIRSGNREQLETLGKKVREFRQAGLDRTGEFGPENLAFKVLRSNGTLDQLRAARLAAKDQELSIEEAKKKKKKKSFRYGFGGMFFPGYHYYGQTDAAADGGGDGGGGGGEGVQESTDDLNTSIKKFAKYCSQELGIENMPRIRLKKDPEWSQRNATFGRYIPEENTLILSVANRHPMDIMRTLAHELIHHRQDEIEPMPVHAGETGSEWENEANARAGVLMRGYGEQNPGTFEKKALGEGYSRKLNFDEVYGKYLKVTDNDGDPNKEGFSLVTPLNGASWNWRERPEFIPIVKKKLNQPGFLGDYKYQQIIDAMAGNKFDPARHMAEGSSNSPQTVTRIDSQEIKDFGSNLKGYKHTDDWAQSGIDTGDDSYWQKKNLKTNTTKGLFAGDPHRTALYATGNAHETRYVEFTQNGQPIVYFDKKDLPKMRGRRTYLTVFDAANFRKLPTGEYFSENPGTPLKQTVINDPFQYIADQGWVVRITADLNKVFKQVQSMHKTGKIQQYGAEGMAESVQQVVAEASGYIPVNDKEARDPRYSMAVTVDIRPGEPQRQAAKLGWKTNLAGTPPTARTNGLIEELTRKLQLIKEGIGFPLISEEELEEVTMSPSALKQFAASDIGRSMMAGFEAELIFTGLGANEEEGEWESDYSYDPRANSINDIEEFFGSGDFAEGLSRRQRNELEEDWMEWYDQTLYDEFDAPVAVRDWIQENDWDEEDLIERALDDEYSEDRVKEILAAMERRVRGTGTAADLELVEEYVGAEREVERQLEERVDLAVEDHNSDYESALDEFRENWDKDESDWLRDRGWRNMSDLAYNFDFTWPHMTMTGGSSEGGFNEDAAQQLADDLADKLDVTTTVSTGYHGARRDASTWIFEPDGSLEADDDANMPVEIVSPPMPLGKALEILPKFFAWAKDNGAYANDSTGFHMSVSMPDHGENVLDYTKLALFLGDEYVLKQFGREANTYAKSAISKIREKKGNVNAEEILSTMRKHLNQFASRALAQPSGFGKYTSINPKSNYIEFRSAGGSDYFADMEKIQNTLMRYARATDIAMDPAADNQEYAKKLYKLLTDTKTQQVTDPKTGTKRTEVVPSADNDAISIFSRYVAGQLPKSELKGVLKKLQYGREVAKNPPKEKIQWRVTHPNGRASVTLMASSAAEAIKLAKQEYNDTMNPDDAYRAEPVVPATQTPATDQLNAPVPDDPRGNFVLRRREGNEGVGPILYRFSAGTTGDAIVAARRWTEARGMERRSVYLDSIASLSPEELQPAAGTSIPDIGIDVAQNFREPPVETEPQNFPAARSTGGEFTGRWKIVSGATGEVLHTFVFRSTDQAAANRVARDWAQRTSFDDTVEVYPEMA
jgi:hypothetical protein